MFVSSLLKSWPARHADTQLHSGTWHQSGIRTLQRFSGHPPADLRRAQRGAKEWSDHLGELIWARNNCVGGAAEYSAQRLHIGARADRQADAAGAPSAGLGQCAARVGSTVGPLVAVVVGEPV